MDAEGEAGQRQWSRVVVLIAAALSLLLLGGAVGIWLALSGRQGTAIPSPSGASPSAVDVGFAQDMSVHHLQAVQMANWERDHTSDARMQQLAFDLEQTQLEQVGRMKGFLSMWSEPEQGSTADAMKWMTGTGGHSGHSGHGGHSGEHGGHGDMPGMSGGMTMKNGLMPGMASKAELADLRTKRGEQLDVRFLQLMLRHHQGGIPMAEYAVEHAKNAAVRQLARSMLNSQQSEVDLMTRLLAERGAKPLPAP